MKNVFALALICYVAFWGAVAEPVSASESAPRPVLSNKAFPAHVLLAKKGTSTGRTTSTLTLNNVRHHAHKKYTRVVFDLTGRVEIKERKNQRIATISLTNVTLSKRVQQQIKRKDFPRAIALSPEKPRTVSIVLDLQTLRTYKVLTLRQPDRVVVDLFYAKKPPGVAAKPEKTNPPSLPPTFLIGGGQPSWRAIGKLLLENSKRRSRRHRPRSRWKRPRNHRAKRHQRKSYRLAGLEIFTRTDSKPAQSQSAVDSIERRVS